MSGQTAAQGQNGEVDGEHEFIHQIAIEVSFISASPSSLFPVPQGQLGRQVKSHAD